MIFSVSFIPILFGLGILFSIPEIAFLVSIPFALYLFISVLVLIHREFNYEHVSGANDNASGVGVLLALGEALSNPKLKDTEVWLVSTGCEEVGTIGMIRFLEKHEKELKYAYFINIDNVGKGLIRYTTKEGLINGFKCSEKLIKLAKGSASRNNIDSKEFISKIYPTNTLPCLVRGYQPISILSTDETGLIHNWHWETDTIENLDQSTIKNAYNIILDMVRSFD
jgi:aminopeptidase-like protein